LLRCVSSFLATLLAGGCVAQDLDVQGCSELPIQNSRKLSSSTRLLPPPAPSHLDTFFCLPLLSPSTLTSPHLTSPPPSPIPTYTFPHLPLPPPPKPHPPTSPSSSTLSCYLPVSPSLSPSTQPSPVSTHIHLLSGILTFPLRDPRTFALLSIFYSAWPLHLHLHLIFWACCKSIFIDHQFLLLLTFTFFF
jgi:hypothetical protein